MKPNFVRPRQVTVICATTVLTLLWLGPQATATDWVITRQVETGKGTGRFHRLSERTPFDPHKTAIIVCDMWDAHHCLNASRRVAEMAPRMNDVLRRARAMGAIVIHAPSSCMEFYRDHPARHRAQATPRAPKLPAAINEWCSQIPSEEQASYPIDQSDGGEDDDPLEHRQWADQLRAMGRDPRHPWVRQTELIDIDERRDYISDRGDEIWSILQHRGIRQVVLCGVHTNMCVLGRPFGLRQMVRNQMPVVLMRDLTDTMYNPARRPFVSHFSGTDLIIDHIERYICPTISSRVFLPEQNEFRFREDDRPHIALVIGEDEYRTRETLTAFAERHLRRDFRLSFAYADVTDRNTIPGLTEIRDVDLLIMSIRRRVLPTEQLAWFRQYFASGRPLIAIRTSSHAFHLRNQEPPAGHAQWPTFDAEILGGNYHDHYRNDIVATIQFSPQLKEHPLLQGIKASSFEAGGSLYRTSPLRPGTHVVAMGRIPGKPAEPAAWTYVRADGGRTFYAALGHEKDFANPAFVQLLENAIRWAVASPSISPGTRRVAEPMQQP